MSSSATQKQMFEGVGAPINVAQTDGNIDPTLDSCCQREIESNRKRDVVEKALRKHDRVAQAEKQRRQPMAFGTGQHAYNSYNLINGMSFGSGCRCCYDPNADGGDYDLLAEARIERGMNINGTGNGDDDPFGNGNNNNDNDEINRDRTHSDSDDSDSDDEFDYLLDEDLPTTSTSLSGYDNTRRAELESMAQHYEVARHHGYGVHRQMHPTRVFAAAGYGADQSRDAICPRGSVVHLYDDHSPLSVSLDFCLEEMATRYPGTKFVRGIGVTSLLYAEDSNGNDDQWKKTGNGNLPMMLALRDGRVVAYSSGLRDFHRGANDHVVESKAVEQWLHNAGVLIDTPPPVDALCRIRPEEEMLLENMRKLNELGRFGTSGSPWMCGEIGKKGGEEDLEEDNKRYNCGVSGCNKSFHHEHVGVQNEAQDGLLVPESQVTSSTG